MRKSSDWIRCVLEDMYFLGRGMPDKSKMSGQDMFCKVLGLLCPVSYPFCPIDCC